MQIQNIKTKVFQLNQRQVDNFYRNCNVIVQLTSIKDLRKDMMLIQAYFGRGKSYYATHKLLKDVNEILQFRSFDLLNPFNVFKPIKPCQMLILSPRKAIKQQQLNQQGVVAAAQQDYLDNTCALDPDQEGKIRITTVQQFTQWIKRGKIQRPPQIIVIDEIHLLYKETIFADNLQDFIEWLGNNSKEIIKFGLTSTSFDIYNFYQKYIKEYGFVRVDAVMPPKYRIQKATIMASGNVLGCFNTVRPLVSPQYKVLVFCRSARECKLNAEKVGEQAAWMVSEYCQTKVIVDGKQVFLKDLMDKDLRDYVLNNQGLPQDINVLFMTSAYEVGVNIKDQAVKCVISDSIDPDSITQEIGRIRHDLKNYYLVCNGTNIKQKLARWNQYVSLAKEYNDAKTDWDKNDILSNRYQKQKDAKQANISIPKLVRKKSGQQHVYQWFPLGVASMNAAYLHTVRFNNKYKNNMITKVELDGSEFKVDTQQNYLCGMLSTYCDDVKYLWEMEKQKQEQTNKNAYQTFDAAAAQYVGRWLSADQLKGLAAYAGFVRTQGRSVGTGTIKREIEKNGKYALESKRKTINKSKKTVYRIIRVD